MELGSKNRMDSSTELVFQSTSISIYTLSKYGFNLLALNRARPLIGYIAGH